MSCAMLRAPSRCLDSAGDQCILRPLPASRPRRVSPTCNRVIMSAVADQGGLLGRPPRSSAASASRRRCATPWPPRWPGAAPSSSSAARRASARPPSPRRCWPRRPSGARWCWSGAATTSRETPALRPLGRGPRALPRAADGLPAAARPRRRGRVASQAALFAAVRDYLAALAAHRPLVLLLDDLHWADPASLDLLRVLGAQPRRPAAAAPRHLPRRRADPPPPALRSSCPRLVREARRRAARPAPARRRRRSRALVAARYALPAADAARLVA